MAKQIVVIGLGRFGSGVARTLFQMGHDVIAIDKDERMVREITGTVTYPVQGDACDESLLREIGISKCDIAIVGVGSDIQSSIMATVLLKNLEIPLIIARAQDSLHGNTLEKVGANRIISPEHDTGERLAHSLFAQEVIDYMEISGDYGIIKIKPPSHLLNMALRDAGFGGPRDRHQLAVLAIRRGREMILTPDQDDRIQEGDILLVAGKQDDLDKIHAS